MGARSRTTHRTFRSSAGRASTSCRSHRSFDIHGHSGTAGAPTGIFKRAGPDDCHRQYRETFRELTLGGLLKRHMLFVILAVITIAVASFPQSFEVASIKRNTTSDPRLRQLGIQPGGRLVGTNAPV